MTGMRPGLYAAAVIALAAAFSPEMLRECVATSASSLFESVPYLVAGAALARIAGRHGSWISGFFGCGCGHGPGGRSLPAAAAAWLLFGPIVAVARVAVATVVAFLLNRRDAREHEHEHERASILDDLASLLPTSFIAAVALHFFSIAGTMTPAAQIACGFVLGFFGAPCAIGGVLLAAALRIQTPLAAIAILCVAGIVDARTLLSRRPLRAGNDAFAYALLACACALVALRNGDALVHPLLTVPLWLCAIVCALAAIRFRTNQSRRAWIAPAIMLAGALAAAPPPVYHATETTLSDAFPGERLSFSGVMTREHRTAAVVRFAITCCRADASPIAIQLSRDVPYAERTWIRVDGTLQERNGALLLVPSRVARIAPPLDPFVYR